MSSFHKQSSLEMKYWIKVSSMDFFFFPPDFYICKADHEDSANLKYSIVYKYNAIMV